MNGAEHEASRPTSSRKRLCGQRVAACRAAAVLLSLAMAGGAHAAGWWGVYDEFEAQSPRGIGPGLKWAQLPDLAETGMDVFAQLPPGPGVVLADDFQCTTTGPITEIHVWGSWWEDFLPNNDPTAMTFVLSIHDDIPAGPSGWSTPGDILWMSTFVPGEFTAQPYATDLIEGFYLPDSGYYQPFGDSICWEYIFYVPAGEEFIQQGRPDGPIVYWLDVQAFPEYESYFGWKTTEPPFQWNDGAVWGAGADPPVDWWEMRYPFGHPWEGMSLDLAFAIYGEEYLCEPTPGASACLPAVCTDPSEVCQPRCMNFDPATGISTVIECECRDATECHAEEAAARAPGDPCVVPDNGTGTVTLPPIGCDYLSPQEVHMIIDGLPPGTTIELDPIHWEFFCPGGGGLCSMALPPGECEMPGGSLGGHGDCFESYLDLTLRGTGDLTGFNRHLAIPVFAEVHTGPRNPGDPVQTFPNEMYRLFGELSGDPDFDWLRVVGGVDFGLPSPGQTTLADLGNGTFNVDSFFDITYQIEFIGAPGSVLTGMAGITTATIRMETGAPFQPPSCVGGCDSGYICEETQTVNPDGTVDICCDCIPDVCDVLPDGSDCNGAPCPEIGDVCQAHCMNYDPATKETTVTDCECREPDECHAVPGAPLANLCERPDNGTGTVTLPPIGCDYIGPDEVHKIIDGLPPGTTIELDPTHMDFICTGAVANPICTLALPPGTCEMAGGSLGGHSDCFESTLDLDVTGTGSLTGFNRHLAVPVYVEVHTGSRNPGDPVQTFPNVIYRMQGELFGDPDFCTLRVVGGTDYGLPSPGETTLTDLGNGLYHVDSFFDVTYQIEFEGCLGSPLEDYAGTTTATIRMETGGPLPVPECVDSCPAGYMCEKAETANPDGTIDVCCDCVEAPCEPKPDGSACWEAICPIGGEVCQAMCMNYDASTGETTVLDCECGDPTDCHAEAGTPPANPCEAPDNGTGTVTLPPDCDYIGPDEVHKIIDGLPPGTTIELDPIHMDFFCTGDVGICSVQMGPGQCETTGGSLGGNIDCFESTLDMTVTGTGELAGFNRHLAIPVACEVHTAPRGPGDPVQTFDTKMFRLQGELFGDPDFCALRVVAGTDYGLPGPGQTVVTDMGSGLYNIDSFFDITYQIEFEGCMGSVLEDYMGTTTATIRMETGGAAPSPTCVADCPVGYVCEESHTTTPDGTLDVCCECVPDVCEPAPDGTRCRNVGCTDPDQCQARCLNYDPITGETTFIECVCRGAAECQAEPGAQPAPPTCVDNCPFGYRCERTETPQPDGTVNVCCDCVELQCEPAADGSTCEAAICPVGGEVCDSRCMTYHPATKETTVTDCECREPDECHAVPGAPLANLCERPDNGTGTITLPPIGCEYIGPDEVHKIIDGLPPGTTIELAPIHMDFICTGAANPICTLPLSPGMCETSGGSLGGHGDCFESTLDLDVTGTGSLTGFNRHLAVPVYVEVHTGPRNPGDPVQTFPNEIYRMQGELFGDPDFCTLRVVGGTDYGLPSPGQTTLTDLSNGKYHVDSFFDVTYQIEFEGCLGSVLEDYMGTTTATIRMETGGPLPVAECVSDCPVGYMCEKSQTVNPDGTVEVCCDCVEAPCEPKPDGSACWEAICPIGGEVCQPMCMNYDASTDETTVVACECGDPAGCHAEAGTLPSNSCQRPDNGTGTVTLPPIGCDYVSPEEVHQIIDGLPPGTTIELDSTHMDFICTGVANPICTLALPPGTCEMAGGSLGGHGDCFESTLDLTVSGTGELAGFNRHLAVPVYVEVHTGPRNPGDPVQTFPSKMFRLQGELFGDPDFCAFRVVGGTDYGLSSSGQTVVTDLGSGLYNIDSFFDITYQIEFEGCLASVLEDYMGTTTATIRMQTGGPAPLPSCVEDCPVGQVCERTTTNNPDGTIDVCCDCVPTGACCLSDNTCVVTTQNDCEVNLGGVYEGDFTSCGGMEACCLSDNTCVMADALCCVTELNGLPQDPGSQCTALEACCLGNECLMLDPLCCADLGGFPQGLGSVCTQPEPCCELETGDCNMLDPVCCAHYGGAPSPFGAPTCLGDGNGNTIDDACEMCAATTAPTQPPGESGYDKNRYISLVPDNAGLEVALRVTLVDLPPPFEGDEGCQLWVGEPRAVSESSGDSGPTPLPTFTAAQLQVDAYCTDWSAIEVLHVYDDEIVPSARYEVQAIECSCDFAVEANYTAPLVINTAMWGDIGGVYAVTHWTAPDFDVDFDDITMLVDKFKNLPGAPIKARADIAPDMPDQIVDFIDIPWEVDAFRGLPYPFDGPDECP